MLTGEVVFTGTPWAASQDLRSSMAKVSSGGAGGAQLIWTPPESDCTAAGVTSRGIGISLRELVGPASGRGRPAVNERDQEQRRAGTEDQHDPTVNQRACARPIRC